MAPSIWQILIVVLVVMIFFGKGKLSGVMEDLAKGIKSFKTGLKDDESDQKAVADKADKAKE